MRRRVDSYTRSWQRYSFTAPNPRTRRGDRRAPAAGRRGPCDRAPGALPDRLLRRLCGRLRVGSSERVRMRRFAHRAKVSPTRSWWHPWMPPGYLLDASWRIPGVLWRSPRYLLETSWSSLGPTRGGCRAWDHRKASQEPFGMIPTPGVEVLTPEHTMRNAVARPVVMAAAPAPPAPAPAPALHRRRRRRSGSAPGARSYGTRRPAAGARRFPRRVRGLDPRKH
jgi:hypothetical protein